MTRWREAYAPHERHLVNGSNPCTIGGAFPLQAGSSCTFAVSFILNNCTNGVNVNAETAISGGTGDNRTLTVYGYKSGC